MRITKKQSAFYELLRDAEADGRKLTKGEIIKVTGYKPRSFVTSFGKGLYSRFLSEVETDTYDVTGTLDVTIEQFVQLTTQSLYVRELGYHCQSRLAKALLRKSRDNMILALELYNRPSLDNRLDAFALLFCAAWEQLLKARIIEADGEDAIFQKPRPGSPRRTISFQQCLDWLEDKKVRKNLEWIKFLRDQATHLTVPEVQGVASHYFQSGVLNYGRAFRDFAREPFIPKSPLGLLSLVADTRTPTPIHLRGAYGEDLGTEIVDLVKKLSDAIDEEDDDRFAISLEYNLVLSKKQGQGDIVLSNAADAARDAAVVIKTKDYRETHPHRETDAIKRINKLVADRLRPDDLERHLPGRSKQGEPTFNTHDFRCVAWKQKWKKAPNEFHVAVTDRKPIIRQFSEAAVTFIVERVVGDADYLPNVRKAYLKSQRRKK